MTFNYRDGFTLLRFDQGGEGIEFFYLEKRLIIMTVNWFQKDAVEQIIVTVLYLNISKILT